MTLLEFQNRAASLLAGVTPPPGWSLSVEVSSPHVHIIASKNGLRFAAGEADARDYSIAQAASMEGRYIPADQLPISYERAVTLLTNMVTGPNAGTFHMLLRDRASYYDTNTVVVRRAGNERDLAAEAALNAQRLKEDEARRMMEQIAHQQRIDEEERIARMFEQQQQAEAERVRQAKIQAQSVKDEEQKISLALAPVIDNRFDGGEPERKDVMPDPRIENVIGRPLVILDDTIMPAGEGFPPEAFAPPGGKVAASESEVVDQQLQSGQPSTGDGWGDDVRSILSVGLFAVAVWLLGKAFKWF